MKREAESATKAGSIIAIGGLAFFLLPALYVLSVGPAVWLVDHGYFGREGAFEVWYAPLIWVHETFPAAQFVLDAYVSWFEQ